MNRKGFTLVELLATIALIAVLMLLFMPTIGNLVSEFQNKDKVEMLKNSAIMAAKEYVTDGNYSELSSNKLTINISDLQKNKYLEYDEFYDGDSIVVNYDDVAKKFIDYIYTPNGSDKPKIKICKETLEASDSESSPFTCDNVNYQIIFTKNSNKITYHYIEKTS